MARAFVRVGLLLICLVLRTRDMPAQSTANPFPHHDPNAVVIMTVKPAELASLPSLSRIFEALRNEGPDSSAYGVEFHELAQLTIGASSFKNDNRLEPSGLVEIRLQNTAARQKAFANLFKNFKPVTVPGYSLPVHINQATAPEAWQTSQVGVIADEVTLLNAQRGTVLTSAARLQNPPTGPAWLALLPAQPGPIFGGFDLRQIRTIINQEMGDRKPQGGMEGMLFASISSLWEKADYAVFTTDLKNELKVQAVLQCPDEAAAKQIKGTLDGLLQFAKGMLPNIKAATQQMNPAVPQMGESLYQATEALISGTVVTQTATRVELRLALNQQATDNLVAMVIPAVLDARAAARRSQEMNNLRQIGLAMHMYENATGSFPPAVILGPDGKTPHSWRVALLPYLEEQELYKEYNLNEPWDSVNNKKVLANMPAVYRRVNGPVDDTFTRFVVLTHEKGIFTATAAKTGAKIVDIPDGTSQTIMAVNAETTIPWTKPEDLPAGIPPHLKSANSFIAALADGSVLMLPLNIDPQRFAAMITRNGGEAISRVDFDPQVPAAIPPGAIPQNQALPPNNGQPPALAPQPGFVPPANQPLIVPPVQPNVIPRQAIPPRPVPIPQ